MKKIALLFGLMVVCNLGFAQLSETQVPAVFNNERALRIIDQSISSYVRTQLAITKVLAPYRMKINTEDGTVVISGRVERDSEAMAAIEIAAATPGVKSVDASMLSIKQNKSSLSDLAITANIQGAYTREKLWGNDDITVETIRVTTKKGVVYLTGNAIDKAQKQTAIELAESIPGVVWVSSSIQIN